MRQNATKSDQIRHIGIYTHCPPVYPAVMQRKKPSHSNGFGIGICTLGQQKMKFGHKNR